MKITAYYLNEIVEGTDGIVSSFASSANTNKQVVMEALAAKVAEDEYGLIARNGVNKAESCETCIITNINNGFVQYSVETLQIELDETAARNVYLEKQFEYQKEDAVNYLLDNKEMSFFVPESSNSTDEELIDAVFGMGFISDYANMIQSSILHGYTEDYAYEEELKNIFSKRNIGTQVTIKLPNGNKLFVVLNDNGDGYNYSQFSESCEFNTGKFDCGKVITEPVFKYLRDIVLEATEEEAAAENFVICSLLNPAEEIF